MEYKQKLQDLGIHLTANSGETKTICPKCSHTRKNKNDKCLSVNIDEGIYNCHNCGYSGNVKFTPKKEYTKPPKVNAELNNRIIDWFAGRSITEPTLVH